MFRRREDGTEELIDEPTTGSSSGGSEGVKIVSAASGASPSAPVTPASPASASASTPAFRPVPPQAAMVAASRSNLSSPSAPSSASESSRSASMPMAARPVQNAKRVLTVGPDIQMKGEITSCDRVVIEGVVDASMRDVHTVELSESGSLKGTVEVEDAEISGNFEGDITVRGKLTIHSSGRLRGNITYGEIEIQRGGQISGNIRNTADAKPGSQKKAA